MTSYFGAVRTVDAFFMGVYIEVNIILALESNSNKI